MLSINPPENTCSHDEFQYTVSANEDKNRILKVTKTCKDETCGKTLTFTLENMFEHDEVTTEIKCDDPSVQEVIYVRFSGLNCAGYLYRTLEDADSGNAIQSFGFNP